jgi:hypothetical protein
MHAAERSQQPNVALCKLSCWAPGVGKMCVVVGYGCQGGMCSVTDVAVPGVIVHDGHCMLRV